MFLEHPAWVKLGFILVIIVEPKKDYKLGRDVAEFVYERGSLHLNYDQEDQAGSGRGPGPWVKVKLRVMVKPSLKSK